MTIAKTYAEAFLRAATHNRHLIELACESKEYSFETDKGGPMPLDEDGTI